MTDDTQEHQYPPHLKHASDKQKIEFFDKLIVSHVNFDIALDELTLSCKRGKGQRIVLLIGGSGVGKGALQKANANDLRSSFANEMDKDPLFVPSVVVEAKAPDRGPFSFDRIYEDVLEQCGEMLVHRTKKLPSHERIAIQRLLLGQLPGAMASLDRRFHNCVRQRRIICVGIDEGKNIFKVSQPRSKEDRLTLLATQGDKLKTIVNTTPATIILSGAYDFWEMAIASGQLARRCKIVHVEPYFTSGPDDIEPLTNFLDPLGKLLAQLPIDHAISVKGHGMEIYTQSNAIVGVMKDRLMDGMVRALHDKVRLSIEVLRKGYLAPMALEKIRRESEDGVIAVRRYFQVGNAAEELSATAQRIEFAAPKPRQKLKVGETKPDHREEAAKKWKS